MITFILIYFSIGLICALYSYPTLFASIQGEFPSLAKEHYKKDVRGCLLISLLVLVIPPTVLIVIWICSFNKRGFKLF